MSLTNCSWVLARAAALAASRSSAALTCAAEAFNAVTVACAASARAVSRPATHCAVLSFSTAITGASTNPRAAQPLPAPAASSATAMAPRIQPPPAPDSNLSSALTCARPAASR